MTLPPGAGRLPPGQILTRKWPVLHSGSVPLINPAEWRFQITGLVERPITLRWSDLGRFPHRETLCDIHCLTHWTLYDTRFGGVPVRAILAEAGPTREARYVLVKAHPDYTTNLSLADLDREENLLATHYAGEPLAPEHGGPVRLLVPHLYLWKSAKWVTGFELMEEDQPGFWERNGYHMRGDPWSEQRYGRPDPARMRRGSRGGTGT